MPARRFSRSGTPRRVATLSVHTSPLDQPGAGDAGGMNVYIVEASRRLAARGIEVDIFTRATSSDLPPGGRDEPGRDRPARQRRPVRGPGQGGAPRPALRLHRRRAARGGPARARLLRRRPLALLALRPGRLAGPRPVERAAGPHRAHPRQGQERGAGRRRPARAPRPRHRRGAGRRRGRPADRQHRRGGPPAGPPLRRRPVAHPRRPARRRPRPLLPRATAPPPAARSACPRTPSCCSSSAASSRSRRPTSCCTPPRSCSPTTPRCAAGCACTSSAPPAAPASTPPSSCRSSPRSLGIADVVTFFPPQPPERLADHYRAADVAVVPSHNESFGLVALEAQACGTPVVAAAVGGLRTAVRDGVSGVLVDGHDPRDYAAAVRAVLARRELLVGRRPPARRALLLGPHRRRAGRGLHVGRRGHGRRAPAGPPPRRVGPLRALPGVQVAR